MAGAKSDVCKNAMNLGELYFMYTNAITHSHKFDKHEILIAWQCPETMWKRRKFMHFSGMPSFRVPNRFEFSIRCELK